MNSDHFYEMPKEMKDKFSEMFEPVEKTGKQLKEELSDEDKMIVFERRKAALQQQTKK